MNVAARWIALLAMSMANSAFAAKDVSAWEFGVAVYPTVVRVGENYSSVIAVAGHGQLHLEARYNYESIGTRTAFVGWTFSGGESVSWELTPLLGGAWGDTRAFVPGFEASVAWRRFDFYVEAEYVRDRRETEASYFYAWTELGFSPAEPLRVGIAGQRTRVYGNERDIQRGPFLQLSWRRMKVGGYWFNPGSHEQVFVGYIGVTF